MADTLQQQKLARGQPAGRAAAPGARLLPGLALASAASSGAAGCTLYLLLAPALAGIALVLLAACCCR